MGRSERRAGYLAAALLVAGTALAVGGGLLRPAGLGEEYSWRLGSPATSSAATAYREGAPVPLGTRDLQGVAVGEDGAVAVIAGAELAWLGPAGAVDRRTPLPAPAFCLALAGGRCYAGLRDRVVVLDRAGVVLAEWEGLGERAWLTSIAVRGEDVLVTDAGNRVVWRFDAAGRLLGVIGKRDRAAGEDGFVVPSPYFDLAFSPQGDLWVVNPGEHRVQRRGLDGSLLGSWGATSLGPEGFSGCCNPSHLALLADGTFVTSEKGTPRVKHLDRDGRLLEMVAGPEAFAPYAIDLDLAVDARGRVLVLDPSRSQLRVFTRAADVAPQGAGGG